MSSVSALPGEAVCRAGPALAREDLARLRRRAVFDCFKWDPQVEDVATLAPFPLLLSGETWSELARLAEALAGEALAAEAELLERPELHRALGLPRAVRAALRRARKVGPAAGVARLIRFDFHPTPDGWRISEANTDVPGGLNEASGLAALVAREYPGTVPAGDPAGAYADAILAGAPPRARIALVHATAYSDDHQVMRYLAQRLEARGAVPLLLSPAHLRWIEGRAWVAGAPVDRLLRFFPGEWLPGLPAESGWPSWFAGARTPMSNPASALLTQSKRFPLVWDALRTPLPTWRSRLPETRDPRQASWRESEEWVLKPALGRVGEAVGIAGITPPREWRSIARSAFWRPWHWVAQRRFAAAPIGELYPCIGVYTVGARAAGAYGRVARRPLIDARAQDAAVLVEGA